MLSDVNIFFTFSGEGRPEGEKKKENHQAAFGSRQHLGGDARV